MRNIAVLVAIVAFAVCMPLAASAQASTFKQDAPDLTPSVRQGVVTDSFATGTEDSPRYGIRQESSDTGSNIRRNLVTGFIPFDKRYDELTPAQQALFRSRYERLGPRDEPPFPANGLATVYKAISVAQAVMQVKGKLAMFVEISSKGEPLSVSVVESPDPKFTRAVASILMLEKYKPALCDGTPCQMGFPVRLELELR